MLSLREYSVITKFMKIIKAIKCALLWKINKQHKEHCENSQFFYNFKLSRDSINNVRLR